MGNGNGEKNIRLGFVGLRNNGCRHVRLAQELPSVSVAALADTDEQRVEAAAQEVDTAVARYTSAETLFKEAEVDAVVLSLPNYLHAPMSIAAMRQGIHVLVEKPLARNSEEAREMIAERDKNGCCLMVGMNQRFVPTRVTARKLIADGAIGTVQQCHTYWLRDYTAIWGNKGRGDWCLSWEKSGGGPMLDLGIHKLDMALYVAGIQSDVRDIAAFTTSGIGKKKAAEQGKSYELEDYAFGLVRFENDFAMTVAASYFLGVPGETQKAVIIGTEGSVEIVGKEATLTTWSNGEPDTSPIEPDKTTATSCVEHFCRVLRKEEALIPTAEEGLQALQIVEGIYQNAQR